jgi:hypothetical protein
VLNFYATYADPEYIAQEINPQEPQSLLEAEKVFEGDTVEIFQSRYRVHKVSMLYVFL